MEIWKPFFFLNCFFGDRVLLCSPGWPGTYLPPQRWDHVCVTTPVQLKSFYDYQSKHPRSKTKSNKVGFLESSTVLTNSYLGLAKRRREFASIPVGRKGGRNAISHLTEIKEPLWEYCFECSNLTQWETPRKRKTTNNEYRMWTTHDKILY